MNAKTKKQVPALDWFKWFVVVALIAAAVVGNALYGDVPLLARTAGVVVLALIAVAIAMTTAKGREVNQLRKEAWTEVRRMVRPTRQETMQTTLVVVAFVLVVALILWLADSIISFLISLAI